MATTSTSTSRTLGRDSEHKLSAITWAAVALVVIGALNWGLVGLFGFNLVSAIFGDSILSRIVYVVVAAAGLYLIADAARLREARRGGHLATV